MLFYEYVACSYASPNTFDIARIRDIILIS